VPLAHPALQELYGRSYIDTYHGTGLNQSTATFGDRSGRRWSVRNYAKLSVAQSWQPPHLQKAWVYYGLFPNAVITFTPESVQFYQEIPLSPGQTRITGRLYRRADETRKLRAARYLARRIDRETSAEDQQLSIWSNEAMKSSAFDCFHLSDLEYGVRLHHDMLRGLLPVMTQNHAPTESEIAALNAKMLDQSTASNLKLTQTSGGTTQ
jgi:carnitine monooxygenase subunit